MESLVINIVNPKAKRLIEDLESLELITISRENDWREIVERIREKATDPPTLDEITEEVEHVRADRYASKK